MPHPARLRLLSFAALAALWAAGPACAGGALPPGLSWNWNLEGGIPGGAEIIDYDPKLGTGNKAKVQRGNARFVICYFSAGSWEKGRPDMEGLKRGQDYKNVLKGGNEGGNWNAEGEPERWVNIDSPAVRAVMVGRLQDARARGCDAVEPDNLDGDLTEDNASGFGKTPAQTLAYYNFLTKEAHRLGLSIGLKNADDLVGQVAKIFDFVIVEECFKNGEKECLKYKPFLDQRKAVLIAEYGASPKLCQSVKTLLPGASLTLFPGHRMVKDGNPCP